MPAGLNIPCGEEQYVSHSWDPEVSDGRVCHNINHIHVRFQKRTFCNMRVSDQHSHKESDEDLRRRLSPWFT